MDKVINSEITDSFKNSIKKRLTSSVYGTFIIYWLIFHWNFIFTIFFVSEDKIWDSMGLLKNDYLIKNFFDYSNLSFYSLWIIPIILTYLTIWIFPKYVIIPAFKKEEEYETEKILFRLSEQRKIEAAKVGVERETVKKVTAVAEKVLQEKKIKSNDPTIGWQEELKNTISVPMILEAIKNAVRVIYQTGGEFVTDPIANSSYRAFISPDLLSR